MRLLLARDQDMAETLLMWTEMMFVILPGNSAAMLTLTSTESVITATSTRMDVEAISQILMTMVFVMIISIRECAGAVVFEVAETDSRW